MVRSFVALDLAEQVRANIAQAITELTFIPAIRWIAPANFHLTIKFLGEIDESRIDPIGAALDTQLRPFPRFGINAKGLGVFPDLRRPKILWVGFAGEQLFNLVSRVESALSPLGFTPEDRPFTPHLTIGRWRQFKRPPKNLAAELLKWRDREFGESVIDKAILYQSVLKPEGATYQSLKIVPLEGQRGE